MDLCFACTGGWQTEDADWAAAARLNLERLHDCAHFMGMRGRLCILRARTEIPST